MKKVWILDAHYGTTKEVSDQIMDMGQDRETGQNSYIQWDWDEDPKDYPIISNYLLSQLTAEEVEKHADVYIHIWW